MPLHDASRIAMLCLAAAAMPALGATSGVSPNGFLITHRAELGATPAEVYLALGQVGRWWNGDHTYSGKAESLTMDLRAGGCFCEQWDGNSIEHARVIYAAFEKVLRLEGGLGPLQPMAVAGVMNYAITTADGKTVLTFTYRVRGVDAELDKLAAIVDKVMAEQFTRLVAFVEKR